MFLKKMLAAANYRTTLIPFIVGVAVTSVVLIIKSNTGQDLGEEVVEPIVEA